MLLTEGFVPLWRKEVEKFRKRPAEFALFNYLVMNAHYSDESRSVKINGKGKSQDWILQCGDILISKKHIEDFWGFCRKTKQKKILSWLEENDFIKVLHQNSALIIRINQYRETIAEKKKPGLNTPYSEKRLDSSMGDSDPKYGVNTPYSEKRLDSSMGDSDPKYGVNTPYGYGVFTPQSKKSESNKRERGGIFRGVGGKTVIDISSYKKSLSLSKNLAEENKSKSEGFSELTIAWHRRTEELAKMSKLSLNEIDSHIQKIKEDYSEDILLKIVQFLDKNPDRKISQEFILPANSKTSWFGKHTLIEQAYIEMTAEKYREIKSISKTREQLDNNYENRDKIFKSIVRTNAFLALKEKDYDRYHQITGFIDHILGFSCKSPNQTIIEESLNDPNSLISKIEKKYGI